MSSVGAYLRGLREQQGLSVDELSRATRVLHHYLEALESDDMAALPAPVFTKGFIRAYCQAVGADPDEALRLYDRSASRLPERPKVPIVAAPVIVSTPDPNDYAPLVTQAVAAPQAEPRETRSRGTLLVSFILVVVLGAAFFAVTMTLQSGRDGDGGSSQRAALPEPPPAAEVPAASPVSVSVPAENPAPAPAVALPPAPAPSAAVAPPPPAPTPAQPAKPPAAPSVAASLPAPSVPVAPAAPPAPAAAGAPAAAPAASPASAAANQLTRNPAAPYRLIARTTETTWMRVRTEDGRTSEETIPANEIREWISNGPFIITIGNAGGVSLELNGRAIPRLGASGSVITRLVLPSDNQ
jgi:cytoskeleton protein RodZ